MRHNRITIGILLAGAVLLTSPISLPGVALAADDDLYCYVVETPQGEDIECETVGSLKAQCKLMDMQPGDNEVCDDVRNRVVAPLGLSDNSGGNGNGGGSRRSPALAGGTLKLH